jgi:plasmid maintenance system antidote protein VapI
MTARGAKCFPPAAFIEEELAARSKSLTWLLEQTFELSEESAIAGVIGGKPVTRTAARALGRIFGTSTRLWLNLDAAWRDWQTREAPHD